MSGATIAAPTPWRPRAAMSVAVVGASAAAAEAAVKTPMPITNIRRRPNRSPSAAPVRSRTAKDSVYAFTVHSRSSIDAPRSARMLGRAVVTTRLSSVTMKSAAETMARVQAAEWLRVGRMSGLL